MESNQQYLVEVLARKVTLELLNPLQNRIINLQQDYNNFDSTLTKQNQVLQILNQQSQQHQQQDQFNINNINEMRAIISSMEEKQTLAITTQNQTFTNLMDRIEHYSQQLNDRSEKLKELQLGYQQLRQDQTFIHQTYIANIDNVQKRVNQIQTTSLEENQSNKMTVEKVDQKIHDLSDLINKLQENINYFNNQFIKQENIEKDIQQLQQEFYSFQDQVILKDDHEKSIKQLNDQFKSEINTLQFKYQQILSQNNRNISQMQQQIDGLQFEREDVQRQLIVSQSYYKDLKQEIDNKQNDLNKSILNVKTLLEIQCESWNDSFQQVQKILDQFKFDFSTMKQNYKKNLQKYDSIFEQYKDKFEADLQQILKRNTEIQRQFLEEEVQKMDTHFMEEISTLQNEIIPNVQNTMKILSDEQNIKPDNKQVHLKIPLNNSQGRQSFILKDNIQHDDESSPLGINITSIQIQGQNNNIKSLRSHSKVDGQFGYQSFQKKQSQNTLFDNSDLIEIKQKLESIIDQLKKIQIQYQQQEKDIRLLNDKVKKQHERLEFFFLQTKTQINKQNSKIDTMQSDTKQIIIQPDSGKDKEFIDIHYIKKEIEQVQGQITKIKSDIQNDQMYQQSQIKGLQKIRDLIIPKQQEIFDKLEQQDECQKMMIILLLHNELVQLTNEDSFLRIDQNLNSLHYEYQPGQKDENTHLIYRQQKIQKVDFIFNQILQTKKISMNASRIESTSLMLSQSQTLRKQQSNRINKQQVKQNKSVIIGKNQNLNEPINRLTMRNTISVEMSQKYMNRSQKYRDNFSKAKISLSNQRLNLTDEMN